MELGNGEEFLSVLTITGKTIERQHIARITATFK